MLQRWLFTALVVVSIAGDIVVTVAVVVALAITEQLGLCKWLYVWTSRSTINRI